MKKTIPSAREYFFQNYMQDFSTKTHEEYLHDTTILLGRFKGDNSEMREYHKEHSLDKLKYSNSIQINIICDFITQIDSSLLNLLEKCFVPVVFSTHVNAFAYKVNKDYDGYIIAINDGTINFFEFFTAPFVTLTCILDSHKEMENYSKLLSLFESQIEDLRYLKHNNENRKDINKLERSQFLNQEMYLEHQYYKSSTQLFLVLHEVGHHFLKHTDQKFFAFEKIDSFIDESEKYSPNHKIEFEADYFALTNINRFVQKERREIKITHSLESNSYSVGSILTIIGLVYLTDSYKEDSTTHPAMKKRLSESINFYIRNYCDKEDRYGIFITKVYASFLFGEDSPILENWNHSSIDNYLNFT